jgi:hypothetical protein
MLPLVIVVVLALAVSAGCARAGSGAGRGEPVHYTECFRWACELEEIVRRHKSAFALDQWYKIHDGTDISCHFVYCSRHESRTSFLLAPGVHSQSGEERFRQYLKAIDIDGLALKRALRSGRAAQKCFGSQLALLSRHGQEGAAPSETRERAGEINGGSGWSATRLTALRASVEANVRTYEDIAEVERGRADGRAPREFLDQMTKQVSSLARDLTHLQKIISGLDDIVTRSGAMLEMPGGSGRGPAGSPLDPSGAGGAPKAGCGGI